MKKMVMASSVLALVLSTSLQASAARNNDEAKCAAGAVVGGIIGGIIGNGATNGNAGGTIAGAGIGAIVGGSAACNANGNTSVDVVIGDGRGGRGDWDDDRGGRGGRWEDDDFGRGRGGRFEQLKEEALYKALNRRVGARTVVESRNATIEVRTISAFQSRGNYCMDYRLNFWGPRNQTSERGTACLTRNNRVIFR